MTNTRKKLSIAFKALDDYESHIYKELAPLYDELESERVDYEPVVNYIQDQLPDKEDHIIIQGGCRSGNLLSHLEKEDGIRRVLGVEPFESMASLASEQVDGTIINGSLKDARVYSEADAYIASEDALAQADYSELRDIAESAHQSLNGNGIFMGQIYNSNFFDYGELEKESYTIDGFDIQIQSLESQVSEDCSLILSQITMDDTESAKYRTRTIRRMKYYHDHNDVEDALQSAGFARVSFTAKPAFASQENPVVMAWT